MGEQELFKKPKPLSLIRNCILKTRDIIEKKIIENGVNVKIKRQHSYEMLFFNPLIFAVCCPILYPDSSLNIPLC